MDQPERSDDLTATSMRLTLNAQLALVGELVAFLVTREGVRREETVTLLGKLADTISSLLEDSPTTDAHSVLLMPRREHAYALRRIAVELESKSVE